MIKTLHVIKAISIACWLATALTHTAHAQNWELVQPKYATTDAVVATFSIEDFGATGDGSSDVTSIFQGRLNALAALGGGVLFVPEGKYVIRGTLIIPKGITLRGEWKKPVKGQPVVGTILMAYSGRGNEAATPFIMMEPSAAVMDVAIWYPEQDPNNIAKYPPAIQFGRPNYFGNEFCNTKNVTLVNAYTGIVFSRENGGTCPTINGVYGTPLSRGIEIDNIVDVGRVEWVDFSPAYWAGSGLPGSPQAGGAYATGSIRTGPALLCDATTGRIPATLLSRAIVSGFMRAFLLPARGLHRTGITSTSILPIAATVFILTAAIRSAICLRACSLPTAIRPSILPQILRALFNSTSVRSMPRLHCIPLPRLLPRLRCKNLLSIKGR